MKKKNNALKDFHDLIERMFDRTLYEITKDEAKRILDAVANNKEPMFWLYCAVIGIKEGSSYAQGARRLKKLFHM